MKRLFILPMLLSSMSLLAQKIAFDESDSYPQKVVEETIDINGTDAVTLEFPYANAIRLRNSGSDQIEVHVNASINNGENNEAYELLVERSDGKLVIGTDRKRLDSFFKKNSGRRQNCYSTDINVEISIPTHMELSVESISGSVIGELRDKAYTIKTISGDIDLSVPDKLGAEVIASTISGAMYSDVDLDHLDGKDGLKQVVGEKIHVKINKGGETHRLETISGDVMLRAGE